MSGRSRTLESAEQLGEYLIKLLLSHPPPCLWSISGNDYDFDDDGEGEDVDDDNV